MPKTRTGKIAERGKRTEWHISGQELGTCNCAWGCPCQFNALPTTGNCEAVIGYEIAKGKYGNVQLDGLRFVQMVRWPGAIHEGNGTRQWVIDEGASRDQRKALMAMQSGKEGGAYFEIFASVCPNTLETVFAPVTLEINRARRAGRIRVPAITDCEVEPIKNPVTGEEHRARIELPNGFEYKRAEMGNTTRLEVMTPATLVMHHQNTYAQLNEFDWSNG
jgi:hypothetical protein